MQPDSPLRHSKHVFRILLLLVVAVIAIFFGRALFVPATYGQFGAYRAANVGEQRD